jgi:exonuclease III
MKLGELLKRIDIKLKYWDPVKQDDLGVPKLDWPQVKTLLYSEGIGENAPHMYGVGLMLGKRAEKALIKWEGISDRLISPQFKARFFNICIINAYAPTNDKDLKEKEVFYEQLQATLNMLYHEAKRNASIIMGDMNAKIGANNMGKEEIMGKEGLGSMNENGELFTDFCARNQIYHIAISRQWRRSLLDIRVMRGADTASDYLLVRGVVKIKLAAIRPSKRRK